MKNILKNIFKNIFSRKTDDIKVGTIVEVIDPRETCFTYGEKVRLKRIDDDGSNCPYFFTNNHGLNQYLRRDEFRVVGETPKQPINKLSVFASAVLFVTALIIAFMQSNSAADMGKVIACAAGLIGLGAVVYFFVHDPLTDHFCDSIDNANSLTENEDEWLGL